MAWYDLTGTIADWVMAGAAVYAAWNARSWFSQRSHTKGFDKAEEILASIDEHNIKTINEVNIIHSSFSLFDDIKQTRSAPLKNAHFEYAENQLKHKNTVTLIQNLINDLICLERWAIKVSNPGDILDVTNNLIDMHSSAAHFYASCDSCLYQIHYVGWVDFDNHFKVIKSNYDDYLLALANLDRAYNKFKVQRFDHFFKLQ
ncbi:hypothetical protein [Pantoea sp. SS70]|uniref:hypothetical protein n=1 Tax=Pantoea sp. SS70 TaxID=3024247 RepID=UPI0024529634|nr:hypothetical protein [Pantoea sp. SS70]WGK58978.1 hypothetical protein PO881_09305 [Pantoea sp. SS70]